MSSLDHVDILELTDRYNFLIRQYVELAAELAQKLEKFGKYKKELEILTVEFVNRGVKVEDDQSLVKFIEEEIKNRKKKEDEPPAD